MLKVIGLALTTVLLLANTSCTEQGTKPGDTTPTPSATSKATSTPVVSTPTPAAPTPTAPMTATVKGSNFKWQDDVSGTPITTIRVGGTVTWTIVSGTHKLKGGAPSPANGCDQQDASFDSQNLNAGQSVTRTFSKAGTFGYLCGIHGGTPDCKNPPGSGAMPAVIKVVP
jgi:plastocyanin